MCCPFCGIFSLVCFVYEHIWLKYSCSGTFLSSSQTNSFEVRGKRTQTRPRLRPLLWARMWTLGSHSWSRKSNKWSFRWNREVQRLSVREKWLKDKGSFDGFLGAWDDGTPLLKCHIEAIWCARYSRRMVSIMACVVMTVCFYGLFPREWMDVLSPPIMPPSQLRRSGNTRNNLENLISGTVTLILVLFARRRPFYVL